MPIPSRDQRERFSNTLLLKLYFSRRREQCARTDLAEAKRSATAEAFD